MDRLEAIRLRASEIKEVESELGRLNADQEQDVVGAIRDGKRQKDIAEAASRTREWVRRLRTSADMPADR